MRRTRSALGAVLLAICSSGVHGAVVINEIHYAPSERTVPEEFVELYNTGPGEADLSGWYFSDGIDYTFGESTTIPAGGYLVVAQDPGVLVGRYGDVPVVGPYKGRLDNQGEQIILRNREGGREDEVNYKNRFPWPIVGERDGPNNSIELLDPDLDNDLGGSWRPSDPANDSSNSLVPAGSLWAYRKGTSEPSSPTDAWRQVAFDDSGWPVGRTSIGYGDGDDATVLDDMQGNYTSVYLRRTFTLEEGSIPGSLTLGLYVDDGAIVWINGTEIHRAHVPGGDIPYNGTGNSHEAGWEETALANPGAYLAAGTNVVAVQALNVSPSSSDFSIDLKLLASSAGQGPTPGAANAMYTSRPPPQMRQVNHQPQEPVSGTPVLVSAKVTGAAGASVTGVTLEYQLVDPGAYVALDDPEYLADWTPVDMHDDGIQGDQQAGDDTYSVLLPASLQWHRRLVRYRITAADDRGVSITAPFPEDPQPNFAYFVFDGPPAWQGSARPGSAPIVTYDETLLESIPIYVLLTKRQDHLNAMHVPYRWGSPDQQAPTTGGYGGSDYLWQGTLVYEGKVYDHIRYRARGGVWRYSMGKNMWKFDFNRGHYFEARDDYGRKYGATWDKLNFSAIIQQGNFGQRGEQGLFEAGGFKLHNLAGNAAPRTHYVHFRIVEGEEEDGPDQFSGDFQGLYLVLEQMDGRFLDEHRLPDGNLYKMEGGTGTLNNQGPTQPSDRSDLNLFMNTYKNSPSIQWWEQNLNLADYYNFRAIAMAIHDYDIHAGKNYFYFHNPETEQWDVFNWDIDLCWTTTYGGGGGRGPLNQYVLDPFPRFQIQYRNRVRELRDLLFNPEQTGMILDEAAGVVYTPGQPSFVDADRAMWDYNPILISSYINTSKAGHGRFYENSPTHDFAGMIRIMKNYIVSRGSWMDSNLARDLDIPNRPAIESTSPTGFPVDALTFRAGGFSDPQGSSTFGAMKWRIGEVTPPEAPPFDPMEPKKYEIDAVWESPVLATYESDILIPSGVLQIGHRYRVRVRMMDTTERWSRWSEPVEFTAGEPTTPFPQQDALRITEIMYHPAEGPDYEFVEIQNTGAQWLDLSPVSFTEGIRFDFASSDVTELAPGEYVVVVENEAVFRSKYDTTSIAIAGQFAGRLDNGGERIVLNVGGNSTILDFTYLDSWYPLTDGGGRSLVIVDPLGPPDSWRGAEGWMAGSRDGGTPGEGEGNGPPPGGLQVPGDSNQDGIVDISDPVSLLFRMFLDGGEPPCGGTSLEEGGNLTLLDSNGDAGVDIADAVYLLDYLFRSGPPPALGTRCVRMDGCPTICRF